jgi:hypothetical protein
MLMYADVCRRMLTYADVCSITLALNEHQEMLPQPHADVCRRMLTYADVCSITLALNEHQAMLPQTHLGTKRSGPEQKALLIPAGIFFFKA